MKEQGSRPFLRDVTLVAVTSVAIPATVEALRKSMRQVEFAEALLLSHVRPAGLDDLISWRPIEQLQSRENYSHFMLRHLAAHIRTRHALCIQWDGYVLDGSAWEPSFLDYDYIGAPWPHFSDGYNVGNGGFSLRSKRLLDACAALPLRGDEAEDTFICRDSRPQLEGAGMRFAPEALARKFSYERLKPTGKEFGFHGGFNLARRLSPAHANSLFQAIESDLLAPNERWEIWRWSVAHGRFRLASEMMRRILTR